MKSFNAQEVADFLNSQEFLQFEYQAPGMVAEHFGCHIITAGRWVNRVVGKGLVKV